MSKPDYSKPWTPEMVTAVRFARELLARETSEMDEAETLQFCEHVVAQGAEAGFAADFIAAANDWVEDYYAPCGSPS